MNKFTCAMCHQTFYSDPGFTEEDRIAEEKRLFGTVLPEERASVCDGCFNKIHPDLHPHAVETAMKETIRARVNSAS